MTKEWTEVGLFGTIMIVGLPMLMVASYLFAR